MPNTRESEFPTVYWADTEVRFLTYSEDPVVDADVNASLVFAFLGSRCVVADIRERGWCIPSGRREIGETAEATAHREAWEEAGLMLGPLRRIGHYILRKPVDHESRLAAVFVCSVQTLDALPPGSESRSVRLMTLRDMKQNYYVWDALIEAVARYAFSVRPATTL